MTRDRSVAEVDLATAFDRGAPHYDLLTALNPGYHRHLRSAARALLARIGDRPGLRLLDLACGSGASTRALLAVAPPDAAVLGLDASEGMLAQARGKDWPARVRFGRAESGALDVDAVGRASFDGALTAYLLRNVSADRRDAAIAELHALLADGGWLVIQEYSVRDDPRAQAVWTAVCRSILIPLARLVDGDTTLYRYLERSVVEFDSAAVLMERLHRAGFTDVAVRTVPGWQRGILHTFVARKPVEEDRQ